LTERGSFKGYVLSENLIFFSLEACFSLCDVLLGMYAAFTYLLQVPLPLLPTTTVDKHLNGRRSVTTITDRESAQINETRETHCNMIFQLKRMKQTLDKVGWIVVYFNV